MFRELKQRRKWKQKDSYTQSQKETAEMSWKPNQELELGKL